MKIVEVVWDDAFCSTGDITIKSAQKAKPIRTYTVGYLVAENEDGVVLASDTYPKTPKSFKVHNLIPHGMIVAVYEICVAPLKL